jgi:hypothetical protein
MLNRVRGKRKKEKEKRKKKKEIMVNSLSQPESFISSDIPSLSFFHLFPRLVLSPHEIF